MTGLFLQGHDDYSLDDIEDRYFKIAASAEQFLVTQFGLSTFKWTGEGYEARSFNIHLFPAPHDDVDRRFLCQASSLLFLASQGFDFNKVRSQVVMVEWGGGSKWARSKQGAKGVLCSPAILRQEVTRRCAVPTYG
jgi:hypothetical protein